MEKNSRPNWGIGVLFLTVIGIVLVSCGTHDSTFAVLAATMIASVFLLIWHPIMLLAEIQMVLTLAVVIVGTVFLRTIAWQMKVSEPGQQLWAQRCGVISEVALWGAVLLWVLFTIYHVFAVGWRMLRPKADVQT